MWLYASPQIAAPDRSTTPRIEPPRQQRSNTAWQRLATPSGSGRSAAHDPLEAEADTIGRDIAQDSHYRSAHDAGVTRGDGAGLPAALTTYFAQRLGTDARDVRVHSGTGGISAARSMSADAVALGSDISFDASRFSPDSPDGRELLAHEMVHVAQQSSEAGLGGASEPRVHGRATASLGAQLRPAQLIDGFTFLGNTVEGGLNPALRDRLVAVEAHLQKRYDALGANHPDRVQFGGDPKSLRDWAGITSVRSWRPDSKGLSATSKHASGSAVDVNYDLQPYIATRSTVGDKTVYGGEAAGAHLQAERKAATDVYDRAMAFELGSGRTADISSRKPGESTAAAYTRVSNVDRALSHYLRHAFLEDPTSVTRPPIRNVEGASEDDLLKAIPTTERRPEAQAIGDLEALMGNTFSAGQEFQKSHPGWPFTPRQQYFRMLRDYELVRVPMQRGDPSASPANTRNPTQGFLHMRRELVEAMVDIGRLRWGAVDLGEHASGDVHHFDLGHHGGVTPDGTP